MSDNFSNFDILFRVEQGKKLTQAQFVKNYEDIMSNNSGEDISIFGTNMQGFIGEMFEILNTNKAQDGAEEELDAEEIAALRTFVDDGDDNSTVSNNDVNILLQKAMDKIKEKYKNAELLSPKKMYEQALQNANGDMRNSSYIQELSNDIVALESMISLRQTNSDILINQYESEIDKLVQESNLYTKEYKEQYKNERNEANKLQKQMKEAQSKMSANQSEMDNISFERTVLSSQLEAMSDEDREKYSDLYNERSSELSNSQSRLDSLIKENKKLSADYSGYSAKLNNINKKINSRQQALQKADVSIKNQIQDYRNKINIENESCKRDIEEYTNRIQNLKSAREYAIQNISYASSSDGDAVVESASHANDNAISFDELESQGLKYSSDKGQALASDVYNHRVGFTGYCARHVADGLKRTGLGNERANATDMDNKLVNNNNFRAVKITSKEQLKSLPAGCIVVYEKGAAGYNAKYGHIEVTMGDGTAVSDGVTRNMRYSDSMTVFVPVEQA